MNGYKTAIFCTLLAVVTVANYHEGAISADTLFARLLEVGALLGIRHAIAKGPNE